MKQIVFYSGQIGEVSEDSIMNQFIEWQGGHGWLIVGAFHAAIGSPKMKIQEQIDGVALDVPIDLPEFITSGGIYPFYAPRGTFFTFNIQVLLGEKLSYDNIILRGDAPD